MTGEHQINWGIGPSVAGHPAPADYAMLLAVPRQLSDDEREALKAAFLAKGYRASSVVGKAAFAIQRRKRSTDIDALLATDSENGK